jgi:hypothetical protein
LCPPRNRQLRRSRPALRQPPTQRSRLRASTSPATTASSSSPPTRYHLPAKRPSRGFCWRDRRIYMFLRRSHPTRTSGPRWASRWPPPQRLRLSCHHRRRRSTHTIANSMASPPPHPRLEIPWDASDGPPPPWLQPLIPPGLGKKPAAAGSGSTNSKNMKCYVHICLCLNNRYGLF